MSKSARLEDAVRASTSSLWRDRPFLLFWTGRSISILGSTISAVVLPILVFTLTQSPLLTAGLAALEVIPYLLFGLIAGAIADRGNRRRLMIGCDLLNALLLASIPLAQLAGILALAQIYIVGFLSATAFVWFDAANFGALPAIVGKDRLIAANSAIWSAATVIGIVGPGVAGALATLYGPAQAVSVDALSYLLSACALALIPRAFSTATGSASGAAAGGGSIRDPIIRRTARDIGAGLRFIWWQPLVRTMTFLGFGNSLTGGAVVGLLVVYGVQALGVAQSDLRLGLLFTASALGSLVASLLLPRLIRRFPPGWITLAGLAVSLICLLGLALAPTYPVGLVFLLLWDGAFTLTIINGISLRQLVTPDHLQSRVNASARMIAWGGTPFGAALGGVLAQAFDVRIAYLVMAGGAALSLALGLFSPLRQRALAMTPEETSDGGRKDADVVESRE
ncbi:MAG TPA: MFS transporter [Ktedonobacterales bacterium]|jgi:MFS family permease